MQAVQTLTRLGEPSTRARTRWMLGFHRRLVRRWEWLSFIPNQGCLPHTSHTAAMTGNLGDAGSTDRGQTGRPRYQRMDGYRHPADWWPGAPMTGDHIPEQPEQRHRAQPHSHGSARAGARHKGSL